MSSWTWGWGHAVWRWPHPKTGGSPRTGLCASPPAPRGFRDPADRPLRVGTSFPNIVREHYAAQGRDIDIIHLHGSVELAPLLGLSDVIVDIVETGSTLRANGLEVIDEILPISARLIANRASYQFKLKEIRDLTERLKAQVKRA